MSDANFASLSSTLLARKGGAKPAMRPQSGILGPVDGKEAAASLEDLGWNDMGDDSPEDCQDDRHDERPKAEVIAFEAREPVETPLVPGKPAVVRQREDVAAKVENPAAETKPRRKAIAQGRKAAFTLRIDPERHLKLRLACTLEDCSAQALITHALDAYLDAHDEIAELAAKVGERQRSN
mgnify:CR=1 FL=1